MSEKKIKIGTRIKISGTYHWCGLLGTIRHRSGKDPVQYVVELDDNGGDHMFFDDEFEVIENGVTRAQKCIAAGSKKATE